LAGAVEHTGPRGLAGSSTAQARVAVRGFDGHQWPQLKRPLAVAAGLAAATGLVAWANPFQHHLTPPCPLHAVTGLWCPFCGGTRAVWAATHGHFGLMLHANALLPAIVVLVAWTWLDWVGRATGWWRLPIPKGRTFNIVATTVLVTFMVLRNLPGFGALAPPSVA